MSTKNEKSTAELKAEVKEKRAKELETYNKELTDFLNERGINLGARIMVTASGNFPEVYIVDVSEQG
jgi:hypothetical protein